VPPLEHPEDIVTPEAIGSTSPDCTGWRMGVASQPVLDIVDRFDLGFETLPLGAQVVAESDITATPAVAQHSEPAVLSVPFPHQMSVSVQNDQGYVRVACVSRGLKARRAARYRPRHRLLILARKAADSP
jgi:hypothetical protein